LATGTMDVTEGADSFSGTGVVADVVGSMAVTEGADAFSGSGTVGGLGGTMAVTEGADAFAGTGAVETTGTMAVTEGADAFSGTGIVGLDDPNFADVVMLVGSDGSNGGTTFTDESSYGRTLTTNGNAQISTAQSKFGGSSMLLDGTSDYVTAADAGAAAELRLGSSDFTIEAWIRVTGAIGGSRLYTICSKRGGGGHEFSFYVNASGFLQFNGFNGLTGTAVIGTTTLVVNTWYHVAACRASGTTKVFLDGAQEVSGSIGTTTTNSGSFYIGRDGTFSTARDFQGYIDELRFTKMARYTAAFTAPSAAFQRS